MKNKSRSAFIIFIIISVLSILFAAYDTLVTHDVEIVNYE